MREIKADLPLGIEPILVADQPFVVDHAIRDFTTSLWQAIAIIMAVSFVSLGIRAGAVIALSIPLTLALVFPVMEMTGIDLQRISLGALIIALGLLVDDAMTTVDVMTSRLAAGDSKEDAATFAYKTLAVPMLTGSFVTAAGFIPIGFARSSAGEYTFSIFAVVSYALILSWFVAVIFAPLLGVVLLAKPKTKPSDKPSAILGYFRGFLLGAMRARWVTIGITAGGFCCGGAGEPVRGPAVLSAVGSSGPSSRPVIAAECLDFRQRRRGRNTRWPAWRATPTSTGGAPMSGAARSAFICPSTWNCRTPSSPRLSSLPRMWRPVNGCRRSSRQSSPRNSRVR